MKKTRIILGIATAGIAGLATYANAQAPAENPEPEVSESGEAPNDSIVGAMYDDLQEVVVTGVRPVVTTDGATTTYNVDEDPGAAGTTLLDLLRKVPMVTVDAEDNILLKGEGNFKIMVNGKEDPTLSANASQIFKMMPANAVTKVEVITEPGAKYDAEGTGGIINLVTIRNQSQDGYNVGANLYANNRMSGFGVNGRVKTGRVTIGANFDYSNGRYNATKHKSEQTTLYLDPVTGDGTHILKTNLMQQTPYTYIDGGLKLSWEPTDVDLISINASVNRVKADISQDKDGNLENLMYEAVRSEDGEWIPGKLLWSDKSIFVAGISNLGSTAQFSYQHNFSPMRHLLGISYQFSYGKNSLDSENQLLAAVNTSSIPLTLNHQLNITREHTVQVDYTNDFNTQQHLLETGAKAIFRRNGVFGAMSIGQDASTLVQDTENQSDLTQIQDITSLYASYTGIFGNINTKAGVRYEHTHMGNRYHLGLMKDFTRDLNDVVPNAAVSYSFGPAQNLRLAYQMRIARPTANQINPYMLVISNMQVMQGNPDLKSEHNNNISLTYSQFTGSVGGNIGVEYSQVNNQISDIIATNGNMILQTYANIGKRRTVALNGFLHWSIIPRMTLGINGRLEYADIRSYSPDYANNGWGGNAGANWNYKLLSGWNFSAYGGWSSRRIQLQGYNSGWHYYGIAVNKELLKDKSLTIGINANNFLEKSIEFKHEMSNRDSRQSSISKISNWNVGINISWNFGGLKQDVKTTSNSIVNDDKSSANGASLSTN